MFLFTARHEATPFLLAVATVIVLAAPAQAQTKWIWDGSESTDWYDSDNWHDKNTVGLGAPQTAVGSAPTVAGTVHLTDDEFDPAAPIVNMPTIDGGTVTIGNAFIGYYDAQGGVTLTLSNGANLTAADVIVGESNNSMPLANRALQSGTVNLLGSSIWNLGALTIGSHGDGIVNISGASKVTAASLNMGANRNAPNVANGQLTISGTGSAMTVTGNSATVGNGGVGAIMVENGGTLTTDSLSLGVQALSSGTVTVTGAGSHWVRTAGTLNIGQSGTGAVTVSNGGVVTFAGTGLVNLGVSAGSTSSLSITGTDSRFEAGQMWIGRQSAGTVNASDGAVITATDFRLGALATGSGTATISGAGTRVETTGGLYVGLLGAGTLTLSDGATVKGPVNIAFSGASSGVLNIGAAAASAAAAAGTIDAAEVKFGTGTGTGTLVFNHTDANLNFAPRLTGAGTVRYIAGTTTLVANNTTFAGTTKVEGGLLHITNGLGGAIDVLSGGTLTGQGAIGATEVSGTITPTGVFNAAGNVTFNNGSTYNVDMGTGRIAATGTVTINGGTVNVLQPTGAFDLLNPVIIASGDTDLTGTFTSVSSNFAFVDAVLDYATAKQVRLAFARNGVTFDSVAQSASQQSVGTALDALPISNPVVAAVSVLSVEQARDALEQLSGDTHATLQGTNITLSNQVQGVSVNRIRQSFSTLNSGDGVMSYLSTGSEEGNPASGVTYWLQGLGEYARIGADGSAPGMTTASGGVLGGIDTMLGDWRVGATAGYTGTSFAAIGRDASGTSQNLHAGIYAGTAIDQLRLQFNALQTWHGLSTRREVDFGAFTDVLSASYGAQTTQLFGEIGYVLDMGTFEVEPFGSLAYAMTSTDSYTETGGAASLTSATSSSNAAIVVLGARAEAPIAMGETLVTARGMLGWQHIEGQAATSQFSLGGQPFTVTGASPSSDALVYEAGINLDLNAGINLDVVYGGQLSAGTFAHSIKGIISGKF